MQFCLIKNFSKKFRKIHGHLQTIYNKQIYQNKFTSDSRCLHWLWHILGSCSIVWMVTVHIYFNIIFYLIRLGKAKLFLKMYNSYSLEAGLTSCSVEWADQRFVCFCLPVLNVLTETLN